MEAIYYHYRRRLVVPFAVAILIVAGFTVGSFALPEGQGAIINIPRGPNWTKLACPEGMRCGWRVVCQFYYGHRDDFGRMQGPRGENRGCINAGWGDYIKDTAIPAPDTGYGLMWRGFGFSRTNLLSASVSPCYPNFEAAQAAARQHENLFHRGAGSRERRDNIRTVAVSECNGDAGCLWN